MKESKTVTCLITYKRSSIVYNKKLCGHDFDEDCECAAKGIASFEMRELINKTNELFSESRKILELISSLKDRKGS